MGGKGEVVDWEGSGGEGGVVLEDEVELVAVEMQHVQGFAHYLLLLLGG